MAQLTELRLDQVAKLARLPQRYEEAKTALAECHKIDECKDWADKAEALASYARQSQDDALLKTCMRIRGRAIRRVGELLREIEGTQGTRTDQLRALGGPKLTRKQAAQNAGLSRHQKRQALRVANIPAAEFERKIESDSPPTAEWLAKMGIDRTFYDYITGPKPAGFTEAMHLVGAMEFFLKDHCAKDPAFVAGGVRKTEYPEVKILIEKMCRWLADFGAALKE